MLEHKLSGRDERTLTYFNHLFLLVFFCSSFTACQDFLLLRQPSEGAGGSKLAFGNEPGSAVGGQQQQAESGPGGSGGAR